MTGCERFSEQTQTIPELTKKITRATPQEGGFLMQIHGHAHGNERLPCVTGDMSTMLFQKKGFRVKVTCCSVVCGQLG